MPSSEQPPLIELTQFRTTADGLDHPEAVAYGPDEYLYAGGEGGQLYRISLDGQVELFANTGGFILGVALDRQANVYACDCGRREILRVTASGAVTVLSTGAPDSPLRLPNWAVFDHYGRLYVSDSGDWGQANGVLLRIDVDGSTHVISRQPRRFPNGLAFSADGAWLYVVESTLPGISRMAVRPDGTLGELEAVVALPGTVPDGVALDAAGNLYVACYRPDRLYRLTVNGHLETLAEDPAGTVLNAPTNLTFAGPALDRLIVANLGGWHLAVCAMDVAGQPLNYQEPIKA